MNNLRPVYALCALLLFVACSQQPDEQAHVHKPSNQAEVTPAAVSVMTDNGVTTVLMTGNDMMKFNVTEFTVKTGDTVRVVFENKGKMPKNAMGHNVVFLQEGVDENAFAAAASKARATEYIPENAESQIIAYTKLLGPSESDTIEFTAPAPGVYPYICSFPAHMFAGMRGLMTVVE